MDTGWPHFKVGEIACTAVSDGYFAYAPPLFPPLAEFLFSNAPRDQVRQVLEDLATDSQAEGEWTSPYTCLLVDTGEHRLLIDTGAGGLGPNTGRLLESLAFEGVRPANVDLIVLTHAHPDHLGGNTDSRGEPVFERAQWVMSEREWVFWTEGEAGRVLPEHVGDVLLGCAERNLSAVKDRIRLVSGDEEVLPGIRVIPAPGHTPGQVAVIISSEGQTLYCLSDVVLHPAHMRRPEWVAAVDMLPEETAATRRSLLEMAANDQALVLAFHFPFPGLGYVLPKADGWQWRPVA